jgi:hypothetical protein
MGNLIPETAFCHVEKLELIRGEDDYSAGLRGIFLPGAETRILVAAPVEEFSRIMGCTLAALCVCHFHYPVDKRMDAFITAQLLYAPAQGVSSFLHVVAASSPKQGEAVIFSSQS